LGNKVTINEIISTPLKRISVKDGDVLHAMKKSDIGYTEYGESYFSLINKGAVKAWKKHLKMTLNLIVPFGSVRFVFMDDDGLFREEIIGDNNYARLTVPPGIWFGFQSDFEKTSLVLNIASIEHSSEEVEQKDINNFEFNWGIK